jgi:hypothetical protein
MKKLAIIAACLALASCADVSGATRALEDQGYTNITIEGAGWYGCGKDDTYTTKFRAVSIAGRQVKGVVCTTGGWGFKGTTIRTF